MRFLSLLILSILVLPTFVSAASVVRTGETLSITTEQSVPGDYYGLGGTVAISGVIEDDLIVAGERITVNGTVGEDVLAVALSVDMDGVVADDVRIIAGSVTVKGEIAGNLFVIANKLTVLSTATIEGDIIFFGGSADISGAVGQDILGTSARMRIDGEVRGLVDVKTDELTLGERAKVEGNVTYDSLTEIIRAQNATVLGTVVRNDGAFEEVNLSQIVIIPFLITLFAALVWYLLFRKFVVSLVAEAQIRPVRATLIGFGVLFLIPISGIILLLSTLGSIFGVALLGLYIFLMCAALPLSAIVLGSYAAQLFTKKRTVSVTWIVIGIILFNICLYIPIVGIAVILGLLLLTLGALAERIYEVFRGG